MTIANNVGTWLASGSDDTKVYIWDVSTGRPYMNFYSGHDSNVFQVFVDKISRLTWLVKGLLQVLDVWLDAICCSRTTLL